MVERGAEPKKTLDRRVGKKLGGAYEIRGVLGKGGTGTVYEATQIATGDLVALKVIHAELAGDKQIRGRFVREAAILRRLEGPHVCPIVDFGELPDPSEPGLSVLYLALARVDGPSLEAMIRVGELPTVDRAIEIVLEILSALKTAHAQGIVHRDLKPGNVLLKNKMNVFVVDFGLAKALSGGTGTTGLTAANMVFGTPEYMSPEQARGDEPDARCDIYSAGMILYELCTGDVPFTGKTPLKVLTQQLTATPELPRQRAPDRGISPALESVIMHAIAKDPEERYPSAAVFAAALLHARAMPDDTDSLRPAAFTESPEDADAFAKTIPAMVGPSTRPPPIRINPDKEATPPTAAPSVAPPTTKRTRPAAHASEGDGQDRRWLAVWIALALVSIAGGVYFALRR